MIRDKEAYDRMVSMGMATEADSMPEQPLHFELCAWRSYPNSHIGEKPAIVIVSTDGDPIGKGHGYWEEQMIRSPEDLDRFIAYLRDLGDRTFCRTE